MRFSEYLAEAGFLQNVKNAWSAFQNKPQDLPVIRHEDYAQTQASKFNKLGPIFKEAIMKWSESKFEEKFMPEVEQAIQSIAKSFTINHSPINPAAFRTIILAAENSPRMNQYNKQMYFQQSRQLLSELDFIFDSHRDLWYNYAPQSDRDKYPQGFNYRSTTFDSVDRQVDEYREKKASEPQKVNPSQLKDIVKDTLDFYAGYPLGVPFSILIHTLLTGIQKARKSGFVAKPITTENLENLWQISDDSKNRQMPDFSDPQKFLDKAEKDPKKWLTVSPPSPEELSRSDEFDDEALGHG